MALAGGTCRKSPPVVSGVQRSAGRQAAVVLDATAECRMDGCARHSAVRSGGSYGAGGAEVGQIIVARAVVWPPMVKPSSAGLVAEFSPVLASARAVTVM